MAIYRWIAEVESAFSSLGYSVSMLWLEYIKG